VLPDHGGLSSWVDRFPRCGESHRKASVTGPPSCNWSRGRILGHAGSSAQPAGVALAGAAKAGCRNEPIAPAGVIGRDEAGCVAARALDLQLEAVAADVANRLKRELAKLISRPKCRHQNG
jgi:hypothetical protein